VTGDGACHIETATEDDLPVVLDLIQQLAEYERLRHEAVATIADLQRGLFGPDRVAEALLAYAGAEPVGFALFFHNFSTFVGRRGLYLEDLFVRPQWRGRGFGRALLVRLAQIAVERNCGRMEWAVLDWNEMALRVYRAAGAKPLDEWTIYRLTGDDLKRMASENLAVKT
jgi:GNAT superfamily N-acetyltransferase